jgi:hypothetical protein
MVNYLPQASISGEGSADIRLSSVHLTPLPTTPISKVADVIDSTFAVLSRQLFP